MWDYFSCLFLKISGRLYLRPIPGDITKTISNIFAQAVNYADMLRRRKLHNK